MLSIGENHNSVGVQIVSAVQAGCPLVLNQLMRPYDSKFGVNRSRLWIQARCTRCVGSTGKLENGDIWSRLVVHDHNFFSFILESVVKSAWDTKLSGTQSFSALVVGRQLVDNHQMVVITSKLNHLQ